MGRSGVPHVMILFISKCHAYPLLLMILMYGSILLTVSKLSARKQQNNTPTHTHKETVQKKNYFPSSTLKISIDTISLA